eukprot:GHRQ01039845.1.p1 GENE.GHRQ01039845.1~~GHRQ01039845.1.p1  ORF type:complete len:100 (-),score=19.33 GHRQ01039845.1:132-431(-)
MLVYLTVCIAGSAELSCCCRWLQEKVYTPDQLTELMSVSDYVVAATPYTPSTDKLISAAAIAAMKLNGVFVNVGRGKCVDEKALIDGEAYILVSLCSVM